MEFSCGPDYKLGQALGQEALFRRSSQVGAKKMPRRPKKERDSG